MNPRPEGAHQSTGSVTARKLRFWVIKVGTRKKKDRGEDKEKIQILGGLVRAKKKKKTGWKQSSVCQ